MVSVVLAIESANGNCFCQLCFLNDKQCNHYLMQSNLNVPYTIDQLVKTTDYCNHLVSVIIFSDSKEAILQHLT